jgi:hypothetical protein
MHASIACLLLYEVYVWVSLGNPVGNAMKAEQSKAKHCQGASASMPYFDIMWSEMFSS